MRWYRNLVALVAVASLAGPASALSIQVSGPSEAEVGDTVTFTVSLDEATPTNGYELFASWDPTELGYMPVESAFGVTGNLFLFGSIPEFTTPTPAQLPAGPELARFSFLWLGAPQATTSLFELDFEVLAGAGVADGVDFFVELSNDLGEKLGGVSGPGGDDDGLLVIDMSGGVEVNPGSVLFNYVGVPTGIVPEPTALTLVGFGLVGLYVGGRGRRH